MTSPGHTVDPLLSLKKGEMTEQPYNTFASGLPYKGTINKTYACQCQRLSKILVPSTKVSSSTMTTMTSTTSEDCCHEMQMSFAVLLMHDPLSAEMAQAFAATIVETVLCGDTFNPTLEDEVRILFEMCKLWSWGHTYKEKGNLEIPGWFFRHVELFLYHTLLEVVTRLGALKESEIKVRSLSMEEICRAIEVVCTIAKGAAESLPAGSVSMERVRLSGALLLLKACESVEHSILNECKKKMHRGHVIFSMVVAKDALSNEPFCDTLEEENMFAHLFTSGTCLNFLRRASEVAALDRKQDAAMRMINDVIVQMHETIRSLDEETTSMRLKNRKRVVTVKDDERHSARKTRKALLFCSDFEEENDNNCSVLRECSSPTMFDRLGNGDWISRYPGVVTHKYWDDESDESPGMELEAAVKNVVEMCAGEEEEE